MSHTFRTPKPPRRGQACPGPRRLRSSFSSGCMTASRPVSLPSSSCREAPASSRGAAATSLRPLACDLRRLRFSRSASFSRSCREFFAGWLSRLFLSSVIGGLLELGACLDERPADDRGDGNCGSPLRASTAPNFRGFGENIEFEHIPRSIKAICRRWRGIGNRIGPQPANWGCNGTRSLISAVFEDLPAPSRACACGGLVARIGPLCRGPLGRFSCPEHAAVAQW